MEERTSQLLSGDGRPCNRHGDAHLTCRLRCSPKLLSLIHIKIAADHLVNHFKAAIVCEGGIPRLLQECGVDRLKVRTQKPADQLRKAQRSLAALKSGDNGRLQGIFIQLELAPAFTQNELLLLIGRNIFGITQKRGDLCPVLRDTGADILAVGILRVHRQRGGVKFRVQPGAEVFKYVSVTSVGIGQLGNLLRRGGQACPGGVDGKVQSADGRHLQRCGEMLRPSGGIQRRGGLLPGQSAYRDAPDGETGVVVSNWAT